MFLFNLLKNFLGLANEAPRKRRAVSFSLEQEFVTPKKHKSDYSIVNVEDDTAEIDDDSDSDVEVLSQKKYPTTTSTPRLNGTRGCKGKSYRFCSKKKYSTPCKTPSSCCKKSNMGYCESNHKKIQNIGSDHRCPTLSKTHRLKEKNQYEELLQNFLPRRIHIVRDKSAEQRADVIEVIDLDNTPSKPQKATPIKVHDLSRPEWCTPIGKPMVEKEREKEKVITIDDEKKPDSKKDESQHSADDKNQGQKGDASPKEQSVSKHIECVASNSLRDRLAAKAVMKEDFIPQVVKRYNERIEQRYKEAEELKRMTHLLSKHNRFSRAEALEEQLARSMRLQEAVLDETEPEAEEPGFPELTDEMLQEVKNALIPRPPHEVLVEGFGLKITRKDIHTLADLNWLNDEVINFYMNLLIARGGTDNYPKVHAMNTFFYPKLVSGGHALLKRWTKKIDIFAQDIIVVPVHLGIHWCMSIIDFRDKSVRYYDSMGSSNPKCLSALRQYLEDESLDKKKQQYDTSDWKLVCAKDIPQQMNGSDCGVFSCMFAEYICANRKITFSQEDMPYFRNKMVYEILKSKLL